MNQGQIRALLNKIDTTKPKLESLYNRVSKVYQQSFISDEPIELSSTDKKLIDKIMNL